MKRHDQGRLHPKLKIPRLTGIEPGLPRWEARTLEKSHSNSLLMAIEHLHMRLRHGSPKCMLLRKHICDANIFHIILEEAQLLERARDIYLLHLATDALEPVNVDSGKTLYDHVTQLTH
jgi:hypothetical protein